jgi:hypothetical protein
MMLASPCAPTGAYRPLCAEAMHFLCRADFAGPVRHRKGMEPPEALHPALSAGLFHELTGHAGIPIECLRKAYGTARPCDGQLPKRLS